MRLPPFTARSCPCQWTSSPVDAVSRPHTPRRRRLNPARSTSPRAATTARYFASLKTDMANVAPASSAVAARLLLRDGSVVTCRAGADPFLNICGCFRSSGDCHHAPLRRRQHPRRCQRRFNQPCEYEPLQAGNYEPLVKAGNRWCVLVWRCNGSFCNVDVPMYCTLKDHELTLILLIGLLDSSRCSCNKVRQENGLWMGG